MSSPGSECAPVFPCRRRPGMIGRMPETRQEEDPTVGEPSVVPHHTPEDGRMLLTITTTRRPALDLGLLLHKHAGRFQSYDLSFGRAHVFYPEASNERCTACLLL